MIPKDLVKHTDASHTDYADLSKALERMKSTAHYVNEKRREAGLWTFEIVGSISLLFLF